MKKIIANLYLLKNGGRKNPIPKSSSIKYGCPIFFLDNPYLKGNGWECRILLEEYGSSLSLGKEERKVSLAFLSPDKIFTYVNIGDEFYLWERGIIGCGEVIDIEKE